MVFIEMFLVNTWLDCIKFEVLMTLNLKTRKFQEISYVLWIFGQKHFWYIIFGVS